jgi:hypothetical protein
MESAVAGMMPEVYKMISPLCSAALKMVGEVLACLGFGSILGGL